MTETTRRDDTNTSAFSDIINRGSHKHGPDAARKAMLSRTEAPLHVLDAHGVDVPHRDFIDDASDCIEFPHSVELPDGDRVHLHQDVREHADDFGDFGAIDTSEEDVIWTVTSLTDDTVTLKVVGEWKKSRHVPLDEFCDEYDPITVTVMDSRFSEPREIPQFGY